MLDQGKFAFFQSRQFWIVVVVLGVGLLVIAGALTQGGVPLEGTSGAVEPSSLEVAPAQGALAPDFTLLTPQGEQLQLSELRGQPLLINFWATWCAPCRIEMPAIQERFERFADEGFLVLAVDFDEPADDVAAFGEELGLTFPLLLDPGAEVQKLYRVRGYPSSFFVDADGVIQVQHIGVMTEGQIDENLAQIGLES